MKKLSISVFIVLLILLALGFLIKNNKISFTSHANETDEHGCLVSANYTFSEDIGACLHFSDIRDPNKWESARIAVKGLRNIQGLTITYIESGNCSDCFIVHLQKAEEKVAVEIENETIKSIKNEVQ